MLVLRMFELCCHYRNFSEAKAKLLDFQKTLITVSPLTLGYRSAGRDFKLRLICHSCQHRTLVQGESVHGLTKTDLRLFVVR